MSTRPPAAQSEPVRIGWVNRAEYNPRVMPPAERVKLIASLRAFGFVQPLVARRTDGLLIGGHQRLDAWVEILRDEGMSPDDIADALIPAVLIDATDDDAKVLNIALNKISGEWDTVKLASVLSSIEAVSIPRLTLTGFALPEMASVIALARDLTAPATTPPAAPVSDPPPPAKVDPVIPVEDAPELSRVDKMREEWGTELGQLWEIPSAHGGVHRLLCGDSTKPESLARVMGADRAAVLHTDPPYGVAVVGGSRDPREAAHQSGNRIENDALPDDELEALVADAFAACKPYLTPGAAFYVWHPDVFAPVFVRALLRTLGMYRQIVVWLKTQLVFGRRDYHFKHESCFYGWIEGAGHRWEGDRTQTTVWEAAAPGVDLDRGLHPSPKPLALPARAIQNHTHPGEIVLDVFSGSGSTMVAAEQTARLCRAVELDPRYVALTLDRMRARGLTPRLLPAEGSSPAPAPSTPPSEPPARRSRKVPAR